MRPSYFLGGSTMPRKILAPHKEQDGWAYWRLNVTTGKNAANAPTINPLWLI